MLKQFLKDEQGQTTVEYLLIIAVIVVGISLVGKKMQVGLEKLTQSVFSGVETQVGKLMKAANGG
ncbi:MAG: Flp family type IVb pilin [Proteobacteria bacterium]|nr:Flp family type IVb pilin [Pseudomonadota bacterium]NDC26005.1 Flp family type IVb pilin [Pseudomonadota bacterium]NDD05808.1 Flp family type IVb pilin [Pseudomonadota bacterium]NDG27062.1 Flp family type IVb pilin [Pseudomonadota bacterium]